MARSVHYSADASSILAATRDLDRAWAQVYSIASRIERAGRELMHDIFEEGLRDANSFGGFPEAFQDHVLELLALVRFINSSSSHLVSVEFDFDSLGDWEDLPIAFHQGARLANGNLLWGPYTGQPLKQEITDIRYVYWYGLDEDKWQETIAQRISLWNSRGVAPEWLYAEFGQEDWEPVVPPQGMLEKFQAEFVSMASNIVNTYVEEAVYIAEGYRGQGVNAIPVYSRGRLTQTRLTSGVNAGIGPSGRPRQRGQFYFKT